MVNQKVAGVMLEKLGLRVDFAVNGLEAVRMSEDVSYSLIFMDCQMPQMDGYTAAGEIRARARGGWRVPIVAMTAEAMAGAPRTLSGSRHGRLHRQTGKTRRIGGESRPVGRCRRGGNEALRERPRRQQQQSLSSPAQSSEAQTKVPNRDPGTQRAGNQTPP